MPRLVPQHVRFALFSLALTLTGPATLSRAQGPQPITPAQTQHIADIIRKMTLAEKLDYIGGTGFAVRAMPSVNLPAFEMSDGPVGTRSNAGFPSTTYAGGIGLAASWDRDLASAIGAGIGRDARARGVHYMLGPGVNIYRSPRNGRNFEYFGEDPFLTSAITVGYITGMQKEGVSSTVKHFLGNNSEFLRHDSNSVIDERSVREIYLPAFEAAVTRAHVGAIMDSYNFINGAHSTENGYYNTDIVRKQWHFDGVMMSDWDATYDGVAAANGGLDIEMPTGKFMNRANLEPAVRSGKVSEATIDEKIRRILSTAARFGWLDRPQLDPSISVIDSANNATALRSARESAVLLKNSGSLLPLSKSQIKSILVVGPNAYPGVPVGGGSAGVAPFHTVSAVEGLSNYLAGSVNVLYDRGLPTIADLARNTNYTTPDGKPGLTLERFNNSDLSGPPAATNTVPHIAVSGITIESIIDNPEVMASLLAGTTPTTKTSRRWTGNYTAASDADYIVVVDGSGEGSGNRVTIDGKLVFDNWDLVRAYQPAVSLHLAAGPHKLVVDDKQGGVFSGHLRFAITPAASIVSEHAKQLAAKADAVVICAGFDHSSESEGGDRTFSLPFGQDQLIAAMTSANPKTIVTVNSGGNVDSTAWLEHVPALLETWYAGQSGGTALAEILFGEVNPSGHLPATFERRAEDNPTFNNYYPEAGTNKVVYKEGLFVGYRGYEHNHTEPLFPFGYGLSYTTFKLSNLAVNRTSSGSPFAVDVTFDLTNSGTRKGADVAQVYVGENHTKVSRPAHELKGFERVELAPGETRHVSIQLDPRAFAFYDTGAKKWTINPGKFTVLVGDSSAALDLHQDIDLPRDVANLTF